MQENLHNNTKPRKTACLRGFILGDIYCIIDVGTLLEYEQDI